jgi:putative peptidoglycan lipid II flippase
MSERLVRSAGLIGFGTLASRVLGMVRDYVQARLFGAGTTMDAFVLATRIPTLLRDLFAEGAMSAAFVPTFTRYLTGQGQAAAWRLGSHVINGLLVVTGVLVVLGILLADPLTRLYAAPEFEAIPDQVALTVWLTRINMPFLLLVAVAAAYMGMLNALRRFFIPAMSPAMYNVVFILSAIVFAGVCPLVGLPPITALAIGMLLGGIAQIVVQWPAIRREGYRHQWVLDPRDPGLREVLVLMGPGTLGVAAAQINLFVNTVLATSQEGAPSALSYAFRLMYLPIGIFGVSVATAALPDLARHAATGTHADMRRTLSWGLRLMLMLSVPATVGLMVLARPIIELVLESGEFRPEHTAMVASALTMYALGIVGYSIVKIASPSFYSLRDARTPVFVSLATILVNLILNVSLNRVMGFTGLALGTALSANLNAGVLLFLLSRRVGGIEGRRVGWSFTKILAASLVMGAAAWYSQMWLRTVIPGGGALAQFARVFAPIGIALGVLALAAWALRIEEFGQAMRRAIGRLRT